MIAGAGRGVNRGAEMLGDLDGKAGDAAGAALDQDGLAGLELRGVLDAGERGDADEAERRSFGVAQRSGLLGDDRGFDREFLGVAAFDALLSHAEHVVADGEIGHAGAERADHAGEIAAEDVGQCQILIAADAAPHLGIGPVHARGVNVDHDLAGSGHRVRRVAIAQHFRSALGCQQHCFHAFPPSRRRILRTAASAWSSAAGI